MNHLSAMHVKIALMAITIVSSSAYATLVSEKIGSNNSNNNASVLRCNPLNCNCLPPGTGTTVLTGLSSNQSCSSREPNRPCLRFDKKTRCKDFCSNDVRNCRKPNAKFPSRHHHN